MHSAALAQPTAEPARSSLGAMGSGLDAALGERIAAALLARDALEDATVLGRYRIDRRIAGTDLLDRFDGTTLDDGRPVLIEVIRSEAMHDERFVQRFVHRAAGQCELRHRHIVRTLATGTTPDGRPLLVRESLSSEPLVQLLARNGWLSWKRVRTIALQLCSALTTARGRGWTAQDLSVAGCLRVRSDRAVDDVRIDGLVSLDELDASEADERNDVFALGRLVAALVQPARLAGSLLPAEAEIPAELAEVITRATAALPASRYANLTQLGRALSAVGRHGASTPARAAQTPAPSVVGTIHVVDGDALHEASVDTEHHAIAVPRRRGRWLVPVAALLLAVGVGGATYAHDPSLFARGGEVARAALIGDSVPDRSPSVSVAAITTPSLGPSPEIATAASETRDTSTPTRPNPVATTTSTPLARVNELPPPPPAALAATHEPAAAAVTPRRPSRAARARRASAEVKPTAAVSSEDSVVAPEPLPPVAEPEAAATEVAAVEPPPIAEPAPLEGEGDPLAEPQ